MSSETVPIPIATTGTLDGSPAVERRRTADRIFRSALVFNTGLTAFWLFMLITQRDAFIFGHYKIDRLAVLNVASGIMFFYVLWGMIWYGIKNELLKHFVGFSKEERRQAFSSRMDAPFEVAAFVARYSERRIRITDMIGRRGRFITLAASGFYYLYTRVAAEHSAAFATLFLQDN